MSDINKNLLPVNFTPFAQKHAISYNKIFSLADELIQKTFWDDLNYLFINPSDFIVSLRYYPFDINSYYGGGLTETAIRIGTKSLPATLQGLSLAKNMTTRTINTITINRQFDDFRDFAPYTKLELFLPYIGFVNLDTDLVMGRTISIDYSVDFDSGNVIAYLRRHEGEAPNISYNVIMTATGQIGFDIPVGGSNANENAKNILASALAFAGGMITSIATQNPIPAVTAGLSLGMNTFKNSQERITKGGSSAGLNTLVNPQNISLFRTYQKSRRLQYNDYKSFKGRPLMEKRTLSDLSGFTSLDDFHMDGFATATESEKSMIETLLRSGIIL